MTTSVTESSPPEPATGWGFGNADVAPPRPTDPERSAGHAGGRTGPSTPPPTPPGDGTETAFGDPQPPAPPGRLERFVERLPQLVRRLVAYGLLAVMAGADAYFFYNTLAGIIQRGVQYLWIFVVALSLGAILACDLAGRLVRSRRLARGGSLTWIGMLVFIWLTLGLGLAWIRSQTSLAGSALDDESGVLATSKAPLAWWQQPQVEVAGLMLVLYLLTGTLTMTFAYLLHNPITPQERDLMALREVASRAALEAELRRTTPNGNEPDEPGTQRP
jgi:hypothetical protein